MINLSVTPFTTTIPNIFHVSSDWQLATDPSFDPGTIVDESLLDTINLTQYTSLVPVTRDTIYARVRFHLNIGTTNWSNITSCSGDVTMIDTPELTFLGSTDFIDPPTTTARALNGLALQPTISLNAPVDNAPLVFRMSIPGHIIANDPNGDTHVSTTWIIYDLINGISPNSPIHTHIGTTANGNLTSYDIPPGILNPAGQYALSAKTTGLEYESDPSMLTIYTQPHNSVRVIGSIVPLGAGESVSDCAIAALDDGRVMIARPVIRTPGGYTYSNSAYLYDVATDVTTAISNVGITGSGSNYLNTCGKLVVIDNDRVMLVGVAEHTNGSLFLKNYMYTISTDTWTPLADIPESRYGIDPVLVPGNKVFIAFGANKTVDGPRTSGYSDGRTYDVDTDTWSNLIPLDYSIDPAVNDTVIGYTSYYDSRDNSVHILGGYDIDPSNGAILGPKGRYSVLDINQIYALINEGIDSNLLPSAFISPMYSDTALKVISGIETNGGITSVSMDALSYNVVIGGGLNFTGLDDTWFQGYDLINYNGELKLGLSHCRLKDGSLLFVGRIRQFDTITNTYLYSFDVIYS